MDPERVPPLPQSEITSPFDSSNKDLSGTIQRDPFNSSPTAQRTNVRINSNSSVGHALTTESFSPEKLEVSEISPSHPTTHH